MMENQQPYVGPQEYVGPQVHNVGPQLLISSLPIGWVDLMLVVLSGGPPGGHPAGGPPVGRRRAARRATRRKENP